MAKSFPCSLLQLHLDLPTTFQFDTPRRLQNATDPVDEMLDIFPIFTCTRANTFSVNVQVGYLHLQVLHLRKISLINKIKYLEIFNEQSWKLKLLFKN